MEEQKKDLGSFLHENSSKSNEEIADSIRDAKKLKNSWSNVLLYQEKKSICSTADKLLRSIKCFDEKAQIIIKTSKGKWKQQD